jgi:glycosyltransferase involved in cell wall biosynthesis
LFDRPFNQEFIFSDNVIPIVLFPQARHPFLYVAWFELSVSFALKKIKPDLFLSPDGFLPLNTSVKTLPVIHDINFEHYPSDIPFLTRNYYRYFFPKFALNATRIATVSEFSKNDLVSKYGIAGNKIDVVYNGANTSYTPVNESIKIETRKKYTDGNEFFFFIGALNPRKNLARLFTAFDNFRKSTGSSVKLVIAGKKKWWTADIDQPFNNMTFQSEVIFTGRLDTEELNKVLGSALALTYVSIFEGFGIPILEAFSCDTPVITSDVTSMPEVGGDAVLQVNPFSVESIEQGLKRIAEDVVLRETLVKKGKERLKNFSWDKTAENLWKSVEKCMRE